MKNIYFKTFYWSLGTTSFRRKELNKSIEEQLELLSEFWEFPENRSRSWKKDKTLKEEYYDFMVCKGFVLGDAKNKAKDAREKTCGLVEIGLLNEERRLTDVGRELLKLCTSETDVPENDLGISNEAYIYFLQLLKASNSISNKHVRPFLVLLLALNQFEYLSYDEFTYLLPLCIDKTNTDAIFQEISKLRNHQTTIDLIITTRIFELDNYQDALKLFLDSEVTEELICTIGINRKSMSYDKSYFKLYKELHRLFVDKDSAAINDLYNAIVTLGKKKTKPFWRSLLFKKTPSKKKLVNKEDCLKENRFFQVKSEEDLKKLFFEYLHLFKAKATLAEYTDLNKRYIKTSNAILFDKDGVRPDVVFKYFANTFSEKLEGETFVQSEILEQLVPLKEILQNVDFNERDIVDWINAEYKENLDSPAEAKKILHRGRLDRFRTLIEEKYSNEDLINLFTLIEERKDKNIHQLVTDNADIPTIFEYLLAIAWFKISDYKGDILSFMKLSLDADLLPVSHAGGNTADIVYEYDKTSLYPKHALLIEGTLSEKNSQRRMEMESVSRHLGNHLIYQARFNERDLNSYCLFVTCNLHVNVLSDFRGRKATYYYDADDNDFYIEGMKIIPLDTRKLKTILSKELKYSELYGIFNVAYHAPDLPPHDWYNKYFNFE